jgi:hypothetical protein
MKTRSSARLEAYLLDFKFTKENAKCTTYDYVKMLDLYTKSAEQYHLNSLYNLAYMYRYGLGVDIDNKQSCELYKLYANKTNIYSENNSDNSRRIIINYFKQMFEEMNFGLRKQKCIEIFDYLCFNYHFIEEERHQQFKNTLKKKLHEFKNNEDFTKNEFEYYSMHFN